MKWKALIVLSLRVPGDSAPSKPQCHDFGSVCLQVGSKGFWKLRQNGAFLVHSAISKPKIDGFGAGLS